MARIISPIGIITGKLGNLVFKRRGNKTYVSKAPEHIKVPNDPATKARKKKFGMVGKFAAAVNSYPLLKALWIPGSSKLNPPYNKIFKHAFRLFPYLDLTPGFGFSITDSSVIFGKSAIFVEAGFSYRNVDLNLSVEKSVVAVGILALSDPLEETSPKVMYLPVCSGKITLQLENNSGGFIIPLTGIQKLRYNQYKTKQAFICLVTLDDSENPIHYSRTFS